MTIDVKGCGILPQSRRLEKVVRKFGPRIKKFTIWCSVQGESAEICEDQLMAMLKCLTEVQDLTLRNIFVSSSYMQPEELGLPKLKKLIVDYCIFDTPLVLNSLPVDVLNELVFTFESNDETRFQNFLNRQKNIRTLELFENDLLAFDHLELETLKISSGIDFALMLDQQPKLRYLDFAITWIDDTVFAAVTRLEHLEVFKTLIDQVSVHTFKLLTDLPKLRELRLDSHSPHDCEHLLELSMMRCTKLEKLTLIYTERMIPTEIIIQMSQNFRRLKGFEVINRSINVVAIILEQFPQLESIVFDFFAIFGAPEDVLLVNVDFRHEFLTQIVVTNVHTREADNTRALLKLISVCPKLERIMLSELSELSLQGFANILEQHQSLSHLSLELDNFEFTDEVAEMIKTSKKLVHLRLNGLTVFPKYLKLQAIFEEIFPNITLYEYSNSHGQIVMKKRNTPDWYLDFKLMDHF